MNKHTLCSRDASHADHVISLYTTTCLRKKSPFYFYDIFVRYHPVLSMPQAMWTKLITAHHNSIHFTCSYSTL